MVKINDCLYNFINVNDLCTKFLDQPEFQRLRFIQQLSICHFVYPCMNHTRFEHSLGVYHLAGIAVDRLRKYVDISDREKELIQLAGMYHDIGHIGFSHLFDTYLLSVGVESDHEDRSIDILYRVNDRVKLLTTEEVLMVSSMIRGIVLDYDRPYLYQIVCNSECGVDVDKLDYLQRDTFHANLTRFRPDYLLENMTVTDKGFIAFFRTSCIEVDSLFLARKKQFQYIYFHKTVTKIKKMVIDHLQSNVKIPDNFISDFKYLEYTDFKMYSLISGILPDIYSRNFPNDSIPINPELFYLKDKRKNVRFVKK
jgi:HD superfamily phosphohydrolase